MNKQKFTIEHELRSRSGSIIWQLISTGGGLMKWMADDVVIEGDHIKFTWGDVWGSHEIRTATIINKVKNKAISMKWDDETDDGAYLELKMLRNELTGDYLLHITDFTLPEEADSIEQIWEQNLERLHRTTGL